MYREEPVLGTEVESSAAAPFLAHSQAGWMFDEVPHLKL